MTRLNLGAAALLGFAWLFVSCSVHAAESYDNCTGFITSLPAVITTQGTWCLKNDLVTAITTGSAIDILTNNVTLDCNDFKIGGLAAGLGTSAAGVHAQDRLNATVRHCNIRGFLRGVNFVGSTGGGHVIEDNRLEGNTYWGIAVQGDGSVVRRNLVFDTGGSTITNYAYGIVTYYSVDILDNTVSGVTATTSGNGGAYGIYTSTNPDGSIDGNRIRGVLKDGSGAAYGIYNTGSSRLTLLYNDMVGDSSAGSVGLTCSDTNGRAKGNVINGFAAGISSCSDDGGNVIAP